MKIIRAIFVATLLVAAISQRSFSQDRPYLRANGGFSIPSMQNLSSELSLQGNKDLREGFGFGVSLGRTFGNGSYAVEGNLSVSLYPTVHYDNPYDTFSVNISHYNYSLIVQRRFRVESGIFIPSIGAGVGYGTTNLITGGGKASSMTLLFTGGIEYRFKNNTFLQLSALYIKSLKSDRFDKPFISNVESDAVYRSDGEALEDKFDSIELRLGIVVYLMNKKPRW